MSDPALAPDRREALVKQLMAARRNMGVARRSGDRPACTEAKAEVQNAKVALGERGAAWWSDGAPDWNRHLIRNSPYADWFASLQISPGTAT